MQRSAPLVGVNVEVGKLVLNVVVLLNDVAPDTPKVFNVVAPVTPSVLLMVVAPDTPKVPFNAVGTPVITVNPLLIVNPPDPSDINVVYEDVPFADVSRQFLTPKKSQYAALADANRRQYALTEELYAPALSVK